MQINGNAEYTLILFFIEIEDLKFMRQFKALIRFKRLAATFFHFKLSTLLVYSMLNDFTLLILDAT